MRSVTSSLLLLAVPASAAWVLAPALVAQSSAQQERAGGGAVRGLLARMGLVAGEVQHFRGGLYGVSASVALNLGTRHAEISLRGAPLGGSISGSGWLKSEHANAESGGVVLDPDFARLLSRRFISIQHASLDREANTVTVTVTVPIFGRNVLVLKRVEGP